MTHILVIDDEPVFRETLTYLLKQENFSVDSAGDGQEGLNRFYETNPDLVLLDLMLPTLSGEDVCRSIRTQHQTPIIMLTGRDSEIDKIVGLELGADDYLTKPCSHAELVARIRAVLRGVSRSFSPVDGDILSAGPIRMDLDRHTVSVDGEPVEFGLKEFELLEALVANAGRVLTRSQLADLVWGSSHFSQGKSLDVLVKRVRVKIERDANDPQYLKTVRGMGYLLEK